VCHNTIDLHTMAGGAPLLQQREIADLLLAYLPAIDAARGAMRVCRAWHEAVGRVHGKMIAIVRDAVKHDRCLVFRNRQGRETRAVRFIQHYYLPTVVGNIEVGGGTVQFNIVLQHRPMLLRTIVGNSHSTMPHRPFLKPTVHEEAAENIYYQLTGIDLRAV
jgi:hypothetical protein